MYNLILVRLWSISHLRACYWYIDCGKTFCPVEEEDAKKACDQADSKTLVQDVVQEDEVEVDIESLPKKEKNKILKQRTRDAERAKAKKDKEEKGAEKAKEKAKKDKERELKTCGRSGKSKAQTSTCHLTETSIASPSQNPHKRDFSTALFSVSRLQQLTSPSLMDSAGGDFHTQGFFFFGSLLSTDAYYVEHQAFPKEWLDMKAFLEMVCLFSSLFNASCWKCSRLALNSILKVVFNVQYKSDKSRAFKGVPGIGVDLMIMDIPEGLPVPMVSSPPTAVPV